MTAPPRDATLTPEDVAANLFRYVDDAISGKLTEPDDAIIAALTHALRAQREAGRRGGYADALKFAADLVRMDAPHTAEVFMRERERILEAPDAD